MNQSIRRPQFLLHAIVLCVALFAARSAAAEIRYEVSIAHPEQHLFRVSMEIPNVQGELKLQMAAWNALYAIRDFSSHVQRVEAFADGQKLEIVKLDKLTWFVKATGTVTIKYATFWDDSGPFNTQLNSDHAFINPAMILLYVPDRRSEKSTLVLSSIPAGWNVASASATWSAEYSRFSSVGLEAPSYDALIDAPIEVSKFEAFDIHDMSPPIHVVIHGDNYKKRDVENAVRKICMYELKLMDGAPYDQYTFIFHIGKAASGSGGGMEHANSTVIFAPQAAFLPNLSAHEFFHLWNVKRIRPASLEPVDFTREMYTRALWFAEGVTNTYGSFAMVRTGLWSKQDFYQDLSDQITEIESRPAELWQSAEQSSLDAWLEKYPLYNQPQRSVSYYTKGQVLGLLLDILIRDRTDNQRSLDDVMRAMNADFAKQGKFYRDSLDVRLEAEKVAGGSLDDFFSRYVSGAEPLPYADLFSRAGMELRTYENVRAILGFRAGRDSAGSWAVVTVDPDSPAQKAGLQPGDQILRWNNGDVPQHPDHWVGGQKPGATLHLRIRRNEQDEGLDFRLDELREKFYQVTESKNPSDRARRIREGLLKGTTDPITATAQN